MSALFFVRKGGTGACYFGRWMGERAAAVFLRGPGYAFDVVTDLERVEPPHAAAAGFLLDFDTKRAVLFDAAIRWSAEDAEDPSAPGPLGMALRAPEVERLDLRPDERVLVDVARRGTTWAAFVDALQAVGLRDVYRDWSIEWVGTSAALADVGRSLVTRVEHEKRAVTRSTGLAFVDDKLARHDLVLCRVVATSGPQTLRAIAERVRSNGHGCSARGGEAFEFVHAPGSWGAVPLAVGDRALVFVRGISGRLYEEASNGHWNVQTVAGEDVAILPAASLGGSTDLPDELRSVVRPAPGRPSSSAVALEPLLVLLGLA